MDWFLYDNGLRLERVNLDSTRVLVTKKSMKNILGKRNTWTKTVCLVYTQVSKKVHQ